MEERLECEGQEGVRSSSHDLPSRWRSRRVSSRRPWLVLSRIVLTSWREFRRLGDAWNGGCVRGRIEDEDGDREMEGKNERRC
jgi:hypothetical protein